MNTTARHPTVPALGTMVSIDSRTMLVVGQDLDITRAQPDVANALLHRVDRTLFMIDSGVTTRFRGALLDAVDHVGTWNRFVLLTTHGHIDHVGNNDIADAMAARRGVEAEHYLPAADLGQLVDPAGYWRNSFEPLTGVLPLPAPAAATAELLTSWFRPFHPFTSVTRTYEELPLESIVIGSYRALGWTFADGAVQVLPSQGHCAGHVIIRLRDSALLHAGDELNGPCALMTDSDQLKLTSAQNAISTMIDEARVGTVSNGHQAGPLRATDAADLLWTYRERGTQLINNTSTALVDRTEIGLTEFLAPFARDVATLAIGGANPNPIFTAMMAARTLRTLGFQPGQTAGLYTRGAPTHR